MRRVLFFGLVLWTASLFSPGLFAAEIEGTVIDQNGAFVAGSEIILTHGNGQKSHAVTDYWGEFSFLGLSAGQYELSLKPKQGSIVVRPLCATFSAVLSATETRRFIFEVDSPGVSVDFGRPAGGGTYLSHPVNPKGKGEPFRFVMTIDNINSLSQIPDAFQLVASFHTSNPNVYFELDEVTAGNGFNDLPVTVTDSQTIAGQMSIDLVINSENTPEYKGEVLVFYGRVISPTNTWLNDNRNYLCLCVARLTFFQGQTPIQDWQLEKYAEPWSSCFRVESP